MVTVTGERMRKIGISDMKVALALTEQALLSKMPEVVAEGIKLLGQGRKRVEFGKRLKKENQMACV